MATEGRYVLRFGSGDELYTFPEAQEGFRSNFGDLVTRITRIPGVDGGFDEDGTQPAKSEVGNVQFTFYLYSPTRSGMEVLRDGVKEMVNWGYKRLFIQPSNHALPERWAEMRVSNINFSPGAHSDLKQAVNVSFSTSNPFWYTQGTEAPVWGSGITWGSFVWGGTATSQALSGTQTNITESVSEGNTFTLPRLVVGCGVGQTAENVTIERYVRGSLVDRVSRAGVMVAGDSLEIDCRAKHVRLNGSDAYDNNFDSLTSDWFKLQPGDNDIRIKMNNSGDAASLTIRYLGVYR